MKEVDSDRAVSLLPKNGNYQTCKAYNTCARLYIDTLIFRPIKENQVCLK